MSKNALALAAHSKILRKLTAAAGVRATARRTGLPAMRVSRFVHGTGADDVGTFYAIAAAHRCRIELVTPAVAKKA